MARVFVITDDLDFFSLLEYVLTAEGFLPYRATGTSHIAMDECAGPAIVVLDANASTLEIFRSILSGDTYPGAIIALVQSAQAPPEGVTHCLTRPFGVSHLLDALREVAGIAGDQRRPPSRLRLNTVERTVTWRDRTVRLSPIEFRLFADLYQHYGGVRLRADLRAACWSTQPKPTDRRVDVHVCRLRRALAPLGDTRVETIRSSGYKLLAPPDN